VTSVQALGIGTTGNATYSAQLYDAVSTVPLSVNNGSALVGGNTVSYVMTTHVPNGTAQVVVASEHDLADIVESDAAMAETRRRGARPWRQVRKELGL